MLYAECNTLSGRDSDLRFSQPPLWRVLEFCLLGYKGSLADRSKQQFRENI
jgi:hypothetical protein